MRFHILTLGCPKNQVDSEAMARLLMDAGHEPAVDAREAEALIVNTCGFIEQAKEESFEHLKHLAALKRRTSRQATNRSGQNCKSAGKLLIAAGCLSQRYHGELLQRIPELDGVLGTLRWGEIAGLLDAAETGGRPCWTGEPRGGADPHGSPLLLRKERAPHRAIAPPSAYLKISDGCSAPCAFCAIPSIKGPQRSKSLQAVIAEVQAMAEQGVKEIVLVAQDTTAYGLDRGERDGLATLLEKLVAEVPQVPWLRIMYAYPAHISDRLVETIARHPQIVKYLDLPLQHASPAVLGVMRRPANGRQVVARLREAMPEIALRSAFIVGFPGETEREFCELLTFLKEVRFDRVGIFKYSREEGTTAATLTAQVLERIKRSRYERAMSLQQRISLAQNRAMVGRTIEVLVEGEGRGQGDAFGAVGRSYRDAPEVDGVVLIKQPVPAGTMARVGIVEAMPYDLVGSLVAPY